MSRVMMAIQRILPPLFVLSCVYMHHSKWKENHEKASEFKRKLKEDYNFPVKVEFHTKQFIQDKDPYHARFTPQIRKEILSLYFKLISVLDLRIINVVIDKRNVLTSDYNVLENALTYSIQRIENDMNRSSAKSKFMIITDEGRVSKMTSVSRKIQKINYIPSKYNQNTYRREISNLIEDPLPKSSDQSYFIQFADCLAYIVNLYALKNLAKNPSEWPKRVRRVLDYGDEVDLLETVKNNLNLKASAKNEYGVVYYPTHKT